MANPDPTNPRSGPDPAPEPGPAPRVLQGTIVPPGVSLAGGAAPPPPPGPRFPSVRELVHGFRRCWLRAVTLAVVGAAAAAAAAYFGMPQSRALTRSVLHVYPQSPYNLFPDAQSRLDFIGYKKTQAALIKSRMVLNAALRRKHVDPKNPDFTIGQLRLLKDQIDPVDW